jgi:RNA polymerase sigma-70 factor (ECF subfamily)
MAGPDPALEARIAERLDASDTSGAATAALRGYGPQIYGYLRAVLREPDLADEAFSVFSEDLWKGISAFRRAATFCTWAYKLAWHAAARTAREPARKRHRPLATTEAAKIAVEVRTATAPHLRTEVKDAVRDLREQLTPEEQTLLVLRVDRDLSWREVADVLDTDEAALRKRFERVKERLKKLARERGISR